MAPQEERLRARVLEIISRPKNVDYEEIEWVMNQLGAAGHKTRHGVIFKVPGCKKPLMLNKHNNGKKHLPKYCVVEFCERMIELRLYVPDGMDEEDGIEDG